MDDIVIVGGGIIGASLQPIFYQRKVEKSEFLNEILLTKMLLSHCPWVDLEDNFFKKKIYYLGKFAKEFIFGNYRIYWKTKKNGKPTVSMLFLMVTLLLFGPKEQADEQYEALKKS